MQIAETQEYKQLVVGGNPPQEILVNTWEEIIKKNSTSSNNNQFYHYIRTLKAYEKVVAEYTLIRAAIIILAFKVDQQIISDLTARGYKFLYSNTEEYDAALSELVRRSSELTTRIRMLQSEVANFKGESENAITFEELMATLCVQLGFTVPDDITLARYNEYKKIIKKRSEPKGKWVFKNKTFYPRKLLTLR